MKEKIQLNFMRLNNIQICTPNKMEEKAKTFHRNLLQFKEIEKSGHLKKQGNFWLMKHFYYLILFLVIPVILNAQTTISGTVSDQNNQPVEYATVALFATTDSTLVKGELTNPKGEFLIAQVSEGQYFIKISYVGYPDLQTKLIEVEAKPIDLGILQFEEASLDLKEVEVVAARPLIEVQADKTVFNVDGSINATGNTALELLKKSPGVVVDNDDNIILAGKSGVLVYIDDRPTYMSAEDLAIMLNNMQSSEIDAIEIITEPGARYEAEGNAGIINIRMKKDKSLGTNGSINAGYGYGVNHRYNGGLSLNHRNKKINAFGNINHSGGKRENWLDFYRQQNGLIFDSYTSNVNDIFSNNAKIGVDYFINKHSTIGFLVNGSLNKRDWEANTITDIFAQGASEPESILTADSYNEGKRNNYNTNLNYQWKGDKGNTFSVDIDYANFNNSSYNYQPNHLQLALDNSEITKNIYEGNDSTLINIYAAKVDYETDAYKGKLGLGAKWSYVKTDNAYYLNKVFKRDSVLNTLSNSSFGFTENINAAYVNYKKTIGAYNFSGGIRMEHTQTKGEEVDLNYVRWFPSAGVSWSINQKNQLAFNYNKRIKRPNYQDLNSFEYRLSDISSVKGNPLITPQYAHNFSLKHSFNYTFNTTLTYSRINDYYTRLSVAQGDSASYLTPINLDHQEVISLNFSAPYSPKNWWNTYTSLNLVNLRNVANFDTLGNLNIAANNLNLYHQSTFLLPADWAFEVSGWYNSPGIWGAVYETAQHGSLDFGIKKKVFEGRGNLKVSYTDVLGTAPWSAVQDFGGLVSQGSGGWESRAVRINFTYAFGSQTVKKTRKRQIGLDDELNRLEGDEDGR